MQSKSDEVRTIRLLHMYPDILDLYGDSGNVEVLKYRTRMRGIRLEVTKHTLGDEKKHDFSSFDIIYFGGGADLEQQALENELKSCRAQITKAYRDGVFMLMICGGYQLMGQWYRDSNGKKIEGIGLFDYHTEASRNKRERCIGNIVIETDFVGKPYKVVGFENHGGQTVDVKTPFGRVLCGNGNCTGCGFEGYTEQNVIATYLHGPLLSKNPLLCDEIIKRCLRRKGASDKLIPINDRLEEACREQLFKKLLH